MPGGQKPAFRGNEESGALYRKQLPGLVGLRLKANNRGNRPFELADGDHEGVRLPLDLDSNAEEEPTSDYGEEQSHTLKVIIPNGDFAGKCLVRNEQGFRSFDCSE